MREVRGEKPEPTDETNDEAQDGDDPIGLVENPDDVAFQCATCDYFEDGVCQHSDPRLNGEEVEGKWCCNKYEHPGMRTVIK